MAKTIQDQGNKKAKNMVGKKKRLCVKRGQGNEASIYCNGMIKGASFKNLNEDGYGIFELIMVTDNKREHKITTEIRM